MHSLIVRYVCGMRLRSGELHLYESCYPAGKLNLQTVCRDDEVEANKQDGKCGPGVSVLLETLN